MAQAGEGARGTRTASFGVTGRISHDSSRFYASKLYAGLADQMTFEEYYETPIQEKYLDKVIGRSSEDMSTHLPDCSVHLMVTSPPYNCGKEYDEDLTLDGYRGFLKRVMSEVFRVLVPGGRACINLANLGRRPYLPLHSYVIEDMLDLGFFMRGEIIWDKGASAASSTAWGSWCSPTNPTLRDVHEYILVFSKPPFSRPKIEGRRATIGKEQFLEFTKSVWTFGAESAKRIGHPAPFPSELPTRLIQLYTFESEVILDPFMGSGTTGVAAVDARRHFVGYEIDTEYASAARSRIAAAKRRTMANPDSKPTAGKSAKTAILNGSHVRARRNGTVSARK